MSSLCRCSHQEGEHKWGAAECGHFLCPCNKFRSPTCIYCRVNLSDDRPYDHCTDRHCIAEWKRGRLVDYALIGVPKQGMAIIPKSQLADAPVRSSGR